MGAPQYSTEARREMPDLKLTPELLGDLLNPKSWQKILATYGRTAKMAVGLLDNAGNLLGACYNPQPTWRRIWDARPDWVASCPFCVSPARPCNAVIEVLRTGRNATAFDGAGMGHVTVPLLLRDQPVGALIAGQVFVHSPEAGNLERVAGEFGIPYLELCELSLHQIPMGREKLEMSGELLLALGEAFLGQLYSATVERKLASARQHLALLIDNVKDYAVYTEDSNRRVTSWNSGAERMFGFTEAEMIGQKSPRLFTEQEIADRGPEKELQTTLAEGQARSEQWMVRKDGTRFLASTTLTKLERGNTFEFGRITQDITQARTREQALLAAQKQESLGVIAGGMAHDFNNLLAVIFINAGTILEDLDPRDPNRRSFEDIIAAGQTAAGLTQQLLAYAGQPHMTTSASDLSRLALEMLRSMGHMIPGYVKLKKVLALGLPQVEGDTGLLKQVVMSLVMNATEAIGPEGGVVRVSTSLANDEVCLQVEDSGCGMDEETCAKAFDPFFTTKFLGRGLGLAAVSGIVRTHKGRIELDSVVGKGSNFRIYFPAIKPAPTL